VGPCRDECLCALSFGYWTTHNNTVCDADAASPLRVTWPGGILPADTFFLSGQTWLQVLQTNPSGGNGYYILAHQYIGAVLDGAYGTCVPSGVQDTLDLAAAWLAANTQGACSAAALCGQRRIGRPLSPSTTPATIRAVPLTAQATSLGPLDSRRGAFRFGRAGSGPPCLSWAGTKASRVVRGFESVGPVVAYWPIA